MLVLVGCDETPPPWELTKTDESADTLAPLPKAEPLPEERKPSEEPGDVPAPSQQTQRCKVKVVVEPDPRWRKQLQQSMAAEGDTVYAAADAQESIQLFRTHQADCYVIGGFTNPAAMEPIVHALRQATPEALFVLIVGSH